MEHDIDFNDSDLRERLKPFPDCIKLYDDLVKGLEDDERQWPTIPATERLNIIETVLDKIWKAMQNKPQEIILGKFGAFLIIRYVGLLNSTYREMMRVLEVPPAKEHLMAAIAMFVTNNVMAWPAFVQIVENTTELTLKGWFRELFKDMCMVHCLKRYSCSYYKEHEEDAVYYEYMENMKDALAKVNAREVEHKMQENDTLN